MKNDDFQKIAVLLLGCLGDPSRAYFERVLDSKIERSWAVLGQSGEVLGGVVWCVVGCCVALGGLGWSWVRSWVGFGGRTVPGLHECGSPRAAQKRKGS